ncbi:MAG: hypothetical protein ACRCX2_21815 [Paraclostridium sp.]
MEFKIFEFNKDEFYKNVDEAKTVDSKKLNDLIKQIVKSDEFLIRTMNETVEAFVILFERGYTNAYNRNSPLSMLLTKRTNSFEPKPYYKSKTETAIEGNKVIGKIIIEIASDKENVLDFIIEEAIEEMKTVVGLNDEDDLAAHRSNAYELAKTTTIQLLENGKAMFENEKINDVDKIFISLLFSVFGAETIDVVGKFKERFSKVLS